MYDFNRAYIEACNTKSDINEHLPVLDRLAKNCTHITEFGVRDGTSTIVWFNNNAKFIGYDFYFSPDVANMFSYATAIGKSVQYRIENILALQDIEETDLLFIDSLHNYDQCIFELTHFAHRVRKYIVFHDTVSYGKVGEPPYGVVTDRPPHGILLAVAEFLLDNPNWSVKEHHKNNNGLTVLEKNMIPSIIG